MSECITLTTTDLDTIVNENILPLLAKTTIPTNPNLNGTFDNFSCTGINFSGTDGNTTTAGYYYTYNIELQNVQNALNLDLSYNGSGLVICSSGIETTNLNFSTNYDYFSQISAKVNVQTQQEIYIPQTSSPICAVCCCGDVFSSCCYDTCDCTNIVTPSTYSSDFLIPIGYTGTISTTPNTSSLSTSLTISSTLPTGYQVIQTVNYIITDTPIPPLYIYNIKIDTFNVNLSTITVSGIPAPPGGFDVSEFNSDFNTLISKYILPLLNELFTKSAIQINFTN